MTKFNIKNLFIPLIICLLWTVSSCKKDINPMIPGNGEAIKVNYFTDSDVLKQFKMGGIGIFIDTELHKNSVNLPYFDMASFPQQFEYPKFYSSTPGLLYCNYAGGDHRFRFNYMIPDSVNSNVGINPGANLVDTTLALTKNSESLVYLIDSPIKENSVPGYKILTIPADRTLKIDSTMVAISILHQSSDTESIRCSRVKLDGSLTTQGLPQNLENGKYTAFIILNTKEASNGIIGLRFYSNRTGQELINTGVPANGGHAYVLSISGFQYQHTMLLPTKLKADNTLQYDNVIISPNLRAAARLIW